MSARCWGRACLALLCMALGLAAGPPEVRRVHAPARKVTSFFPPESQLHVLTIDEFERLVSEAQKGAQSGPASTAPRLLKAEHRVRLEGDLLVGETDLSFEAPSPSAGIVEIQPWTPALAAGADHPARLVNSDDGRFFLRLDGEKANPVRLSWTLRSRTGSDGTVFSLGLPRVEISSLRLDLPSGVVPEGSSGIRQGPVAADRPGRQLWRFDGAPGLIDLRLRKSTAAGVFENRPRNWIGGRTTVELGESVATWQGEWTVDLGVGSTRTIFLDVDPGLELLDVQGPAVLGFRTEPLGDRSRLTVQLSEDVAASSPIALRGVAPLPDEGVWSVPAVQPAEAVWTGGRTSVRVGNSRALEDCQDRAGVRVGPTAEAKDGRKPDDLWLDFETTGPRSVAELTLRHPRQESVADVLSRLTVRRDEMELDSRVTWSAERGRLLAASVDLPNGWTIERVSSLTKDVVITWLVEPISGGGSRLVVRPSEAIATGKSLAIQMTARSTPPALGSWLDLPRPRTPGAIARDERAVLFTDEATNVRSVDARGMVWLDADSLEQGSGGVLAWRWTRGDARGRVSFDPRPMPTSATVRERVTIDPKRLRLAARIELKLADSVLRRLRFSVDTPPDATFEWRLEDDPQAPPLPARRLISAAEETSPSVWEVELPYPKRGTVELAAKCEYPWEGTGPIPRIHLEPEYPTSGRIQIDVDRTMRTSLEADGVLVLESAPVDDAGAPETDVRHRPAHWISYHGANGRLRLTTENLRPVSCDGVIREAVLTSRFLSERSTLHGMDLHIVMTGARELGFRLPSGLSLQRCQVDGRPATPFVEGPQFKIPLAPSSSTRSGCVVHLEFLQKSRPSPEGSVRPILPEFSLPVLSLVWQVGHDAGVEANSTGLLVPMTLAPKGTVSPERLGPSWSSLSGRNPPRSSNDPRSDLRKEIHALSAIDLTYGELFTRLDAGKRPLILDRLALAERGITPATLLPAAAARLAVAVDPLGEFGLASIDAGEAWMITAPRDARDVDSANAAAGERLETLRSAIEAILTFGSDPSDRYRSVARWCVSQENLADNAPNSDESEIRGSASWYATMNLDVAKAWVSMDPSSIPHGLIGGLALILFGLGMGIGRWNARLRLMFLALVLAATGFAVPRSWIHWNDLMTGTLWGVLLCLGYWSTRRSARGRPPATRQGVRGSSDSHRKLGAVVGVLAVAGFLTWWFAIRPVQAADGVEAPILAVFAEEPGARPEEARVVLLLSDDARLRALAQAASRKPAGAVGILATSVAHQIRADRDGVAEVESTYQLIPDPEVARSWTFPMGSARDVRATLDGRDVPVLIQPGGQAGMVLVPPGKAARLSLRRNVARELREENESLNLPVIPCPSAVLRLEVKEGENAPSFPSARGDSRAMGAGSYTVNLGPTSRLEVLWSKVAPGERPRPRGSADAVLLWDAEPAGDRVRVRLTLNSLRDPSQLRIGLDPGWVVLSTSIPGLVDTSLRGTSARPEWVARTDPPLPEGATIRFEIWRPREVTASGDESDAPRLLPRVEPLDVAAFIGRLGFRRPEGRRGRLRASAGSDPLTDEEFLNLWGTLPDNRSVLAGAIRYALTPKISVDVAPVPVRVILTPEVRVQPQPGRVLVAATFTAETRGGVARQIVLMPPADMVVERVEAPGLSDWSRPTPDRLVLRFDREPRERFAIQVGGLLPIRGEEGTLTHELPVPLFKLPGIERLSGTLSVQAPASTQLELRGSSGEGEVAARGRGSLVVQMEPNAEANLLRWTDEASRVRVVVHAVMSMNVNSVDWLAYLRYRSSDGPIDRIAFRMPSEWSEAANVSISGAEFRRERKAESDSTLWTLILARPFWGDMTVRVGASRPLPSDGIMAFPDLLPLGKGQVDTFLALANSTTHPLFAEGSSSVQEIDPSRLGDVAGLSHDLKLLKAFHVLKDGWSLRARLGSFGGSEGVQENPARAASADLSCVLDDDGSVLGESRYVLESDASAFLPVELPSQAQGVAALVDRAPVRPLVGKNGLLFIPLGEGRPRLVTLVWKDHIKSGKPGELELPTLRQDAVPTLVRLYLPAGQTATSADSRLQRITAGGREVRLLEWMEREITGTLLPAINRGAPRDQAELLASLVDFEVQSRVAERAVAHLSNDPIGRRRAEVTIATIRGSLRTSLHEAGLDVFGQSAQTRVGGEGPDPLPEVPRLVDRVSFLGVPHLGTPWDFAGDGPRLASPLSLRLPRNEATPQPQPFDPHALAVLVAFLSFLGLAVIATPLVDGPNRLLRLLGTLSILGLSAPLGPPATLALIAVLGTGRLARLRG